MDIDAYKITIYFIPQQLLILFCLNLIILTTETWNSAISYRYLLSINNRFPFIVNFSKITCPFKPFYNQMIFLNF